MASIQHDLARRALPIIAQNAKAGRKLSYQTLATALGRNPETDARTVAHACDILDSAAGFARRPLMALWTVRGVNGNINPNAWVKDTPPGLRELLIAEAEQHKFSDADEVAIRNALPHFNGMGHRKAWEHLLDIIPSEEILARLDGRGPSPLMDSLNDLLGTDDPPEFLTVGRRYVRDPAVRAAVIRRADGACEFCGELGFKRSDGSCYLESHHIIALSHDGEDRMTNVIALCPGHHREAHFGEGREETEKRMVALVREKEAACWQPASCRTNQQQP